MILAWDHSFIISKDPFPNKITFTRVSMWMDLFGGYSSTSSLTSPASRPMQTVERSCHIFSIALLSPSVQGHIWVKWEWLHCIIYWVCFKNFALVAPLLLAEPLCKDHIEHEKQKHFPVSAIQIISVSILPRYSVTFLFAKKNAVTLVLVPK